MVCFKEPMPKKLSQIDIFVINYAVKSGYELVQNPSLTKLVQESNANLIHPEHFSPETPIKPKGSTKLFTAQELLESDPFVMGIKSALQSQPFNYDLSLKYQIGYSVGQMYLEDFKTQVAKAFKIVIQKYKREGFPREAGLN